MKIRLLKRQRIDGEAGDIVEVSPDRAAFLFSAEAAEPVTEAREQAEAPKAAEEKKPAAKAAAKKPAAKKK